MAEYNVGRPLTADEILRISSAMNAYTNEQNAMLRGVSALTGVTAGTLSSGAGFDTSLRSFSKANDEEIVGTIMSNAANQDFANRRELKTWFDENNYPPYMWEKVAAEWRKTMGRKESALASEAAQATAKYQEDIRPGQLTLQQEELDKAKVAKMTRSMSIVAANAARDDIRAIRAGADYDTVVRDRLEESYGWEKANKDYYSSIMAESGLKPGAAVQVYDTEAGELRFMRPTEIAAINEETPGTILPPGEKPADVTDTSEMKALKERRKLVIPVSDAPFNEMTEEQQAETRKNYLTLTQLVRSGQRQNVLLQNLTQGQIAKNTYDQIKMIVDIEDPEFFQRTFGVANEYEMYHAFKVATEGMKPEQKELEEKKFVRRAVQRSGWDADHIYSIIRPDRFGLGVKYERFRVGG